MSLKAPCRRDVAHGSWQGECPVTGVQRCWRTGAATGQPARSVSPLLGDKASSGHLPFFLLIALRYFFRVITQPFTVYTRWSLVYPPSCVTGTTSDSRPPHPQPLAAARLLSVCAFAVSGFACLGSTESRRAAGPVRRSPLSVRFRSSQLTAACVSASFLFLTDQLADVRVAPHTFTYKSRVHTRSQGFRARDLQWNCGVAVMTCVTF